MRMVPLVDRFIVLAKPEPLIIGASLSLGIPLKIKVGEGNSQPFLYLV